MTTIDTKRFESGVLNYLFLHQKVRPESYAGMIRAPAEDVERLFTRLADEGKLTEDDKGFFSRAYRTASEMLAPWKPMFEKMDADAQEQYKWKSLEDLILRIFARDAIQYFLLTPGGATPESFADYCDIDVATAESTFQILERYNAGANLDGKFYMRKPPVIQPEEKKRTTNEKAPSRPATEMILSKALEYLHENPNGLTVKAYAALTGYSMETCRSHLQTLQMNGKAKRLNEKLRRYGDIYFHADASLPDNLASDLKYTTAKRKLRTSKSPQHHEPVASGKSASIADRHDTTKPDTPVLSLAKKSSLAKKPPARIGQYIPAVIDNKTLSHNIGEDKLYSMLEYMHGGRLTTLGELVQRFHLASSAIRSRLRDGGLVKIRGDGCYQINDEGEKQYELRKTSNTGTA